MRRSSRVITLVISSVALSTLAFSSGAGAGVSEPDAPLTIVKTVSGPVPEGTTFTATIECDDEILETPDGLLDTVTVTFDATGQPTSADTYGFDDSGTCTVTETEDGGAATTTYSCEGVEPEEEEDPEPAPAQVEPGDPICPAAGPQDDPITVNIVNPDQTATVTIHNTFPDPVPAPITPAAQIVAQPAFTG